MKKLIAVLLMLLSVNAYADRSGDVFTAAIGGLIVGKVISENEHHRAPPVYYPPPVYVQPQPMPQTVCPYPYVPFYERVWVLDAYGRYIPMTQFAGCR